MKTLTSIRAGLLAGLFFAALSPSAQAASITVHNDGGYEAGLIVTDCHGKAYSHYFAWWQSRTVDLDEVAKASGCTELGLRLQVAWYVLAYQDRYPTGFTRAKEGVWIIRGGLSNFPGGSADRPFQGKLELNMEGTTGWAGVRYFRGGGLADASGGASWGAWDWGHQNLSEANLGGVNLRRTNLAGANLSGAVLDGADLALSRTDTSTVCPNGQKGPCRW